MRKRRNKGLDRKRAVSVEKASPPVQAPLALRHAANLDHQPAPKDP